MRNRSAIWVFTILLTLACLYQLSFSWVTGSVEDKAENIATAKLDSIKTALSQGENTVVLGRDTIIVPANGITPSIENEIYTFYESRYLALVADEPCYPLLGISYRKCKNQQLTRGLDLQGGISVSLEISVSDLLRDKAGADAMLNANQKEIFETIYGRAQDRYGKADGDDFIDIFFDEYNKSEYSDQTMTWFNVENKEEFPLDMSNDEIKEKLKELSEESISAAQTVIEERVNRFGLGQVSIQTDPISGRLYIEIPGAKDKQGVRDMLQKQAKLEFWEGYNKPLGAAFIEIDNMFSNGNLPEDVVPEVEDVVKEPFIEDSLKKYLAPDYMAADATDSAIMLEVRTDYDNQLTEINNDALTAPESDELNTDPLTEGTDNKILKGKLAFIQEQTGQTANGTFIYSPSVGYVTKVSDTIVINNILNTTKVKNLLPEVKFMWGNKMSPMRGVDGEPDGLMLYAANDVVGVRITGDAVSKASYTTDPTDGVVVNMVLEDSESGAAEWGRWTTNKSGEYAGISLDGVIYSFPRINDPITNGSTRISGNFSLEEAEQLANVLEAGALPAPAIIVDEAVVGPTLGKANVEKGIISFVAALILVLIYMMFYYNKAGMIASIALVSNLFFIIGTLASLGAALTLPGIAGLVLTIGMSVDANVLIFERIREELRAGKGVKQAISDGYKHAYSAILDSNITSLLTAIILAYAGSGPVKGFAITLIIGIFSSLFSSIFITRLLFSHMLDRKMAISFSSKPTANVFVNANYNFLGGRKKYYIISGIVILLGVGSLFTMGLNQSVEFTGGRTYTVSFSEAPERNNLEDNITTYSVEKEGEKGVKPVLKTIDNNDKIYNITTNLWYEKSSLDATADVDSVLNLSFNELGYINSNSDEAVNNPEQKTYTIEAQRSVNPQISAELLTKSLLAIGLSLLVIFLYIGFRFNRWQFGLGALIAMFHDVLVVLGLFSLLWKFMPFSMEIDQAFIAAILTVIGYSINDTVVVYDRIREYIGLYKRDDQEKVINKALNTTLTRTINTSVTTFLVLLIIFIFGSEEIRGFSFALMIGIVVGTYSSIFIATPSVVEFTKNLMPVKKEIK